MRRATSRLLNRIEDKVLVLLKLTRLGRDGVGVHLCVGTRLVGRVLATEGR